ncbi:glycosyltransferase [Vibrio sp. 10N.222.49.C12]|uniref:glycosyltransferase n=1 Tax=Vibrio sp. 10N.222.49.C12 TaxID=3229614 RepID=UPI00354EC639
MMKILMCVEGLNIGGIETWLKNLMKIKSGDFLFDFFVMQRGGHYENEIKGYGCNIYHADDQCFIDKVFHLFGSTATSYHQSLSKLLQKKDYDVIHVHGSEFMGDVMKIAKNAGVATRIAHCHTTGVNKFDVNLMMKIRGIRFKTLDRYRLQKYSTKLLSCSKESGFFFLGERWSENSSAKVLYCGVPNIVDIKAITKKSFGIPDNSKVIGHVGTFSPVKNHQLLVQIITKAIIKDPSYYLFLAGDGPLYDEIKQRCIDLGIDANVIMPGYCSDIPSLMSGVFDMLILPSLYEGMPLVGVEAINSGLTVVCSDVITSDLIAPFSTLIKPVSLDAEIDDWIECIDQAINNKACFKIGQDIISSSQFSIERSYDNLIQIYREI